MSRISLWADEERNIIFWDTMRGYLLWSPVDILFLVIMIIYITSPVLFLSLAGYFSILLQIFSFILLASAFLLYYNLIKPILVRGRFYGWFYFREQSSDNATDRLKILKKRISFMNSADSFIYLKMGELNSVLWNSKYFLTAINQILDKKIEIKIIMKPNCDVETKEMLRLALENRGMEIYIVPEEEMDKFPGHFMITDKKGCWISDPHPPFEINKTGRYTFGPTKLADEKKEIFMDLKSKGDLLTINTIEKYHFIAHNCDDKRRDAIESEIRTLIENITLCQPQ
ncbi:MAG: hypothetical protein ACOZF2_06570 [Thermodesulfobacteriota bacterium]